MRTRRGETIGVLLESLLVEVKADAVDFKLRTWRQFIVLVFSHL